jgi:hypothetical protein
MARGPSPCRPPTVCHGASRKIIRVSLAARAPRKTHARLKRATSERGGSRPSPPKPRETNPQRIGGGLARPLRELDLYRPERLCGAGRCRRRFPVRRGPTPRGSRNTHRAGGAGEPQLARQGLAEPDHGVFSPCNAREMRPRGGGNSRDAQRRRGPPRSWYRSTPRPPPSLQRGRARSGTRPRRSSR